MPMTHRIAGLLALAFMAAACGSGTADSTGSPEASPSTQGSSDSAQGSFTVIAHQREDLLGGKEVSFGSLLGTGTPVILNFWAAQCPPCRLEMPWLQAASERYEGDVLLVGVDVGPSTGLGSNEAGSALLEELEITYPAAYAIDETPLLQYEVFSMPTTVLFNGDGEVVDTHAGVATEEQMADSSDRRNTATVMTWNGSGFRP